MNKCIAFVDDDSKICRHFREYAIYRGYECSCYHEAESALRAIVRNREGVWAVCVDLTLPGSPLQGPELITELRVQGVTAPVVIVTEDTSPTTPDGRARTPAAPQGETYPLSIFPESEQRRIAADFGEPRLPPAVKRAIAGAEKAMARSRKRAEKGLCTKEESEAFCAKSSAALRTYLDKQVESGTITPVERKAIGR